MIGPRVKVPLVLLAALVVDQSLLTGVRVDDLRPDLMLLVAVAGGLAAGPERGALAGFGAGLVVDLLLQTPLGLSALTFSLVGFAVGTVETTIIRTAWWIAPVTAFAGSVAGVLLYALLGAILGHGQFLTPDVIVLAAFVGGINAVLAPVVVGAVTWAFAGRPERAYGR